MGLRFDVYEAVGPGLGLVIKVRLFKGQRGSNECPKARGIAVSVEVTTGKREPPGRMTESMNGISHRRDDGAVMVRRLEIEKREKCENVAVRVAVTRD